MIRLLLMIRTKINNKTKIKKKEIPLQIIMVQQRHLLLMSPKVKSLTRPPNLRKLKAMFPRNPKDQKNHKKDIVKVRVQSQNSLFLLAKLEVTNQNHQKAAKSQRRKARRARLKPMLLLNLQETRMKMLTKEMMDLTWFSTLLLSLKMTHKLCMNLKRFFINHLLLLKFQAFR